MSAPASDHTPLVVAMLTESPVPIPRAGLGDLLRHVWNARSDMLGMSQRLYREYGHVVLQRTPVADMVTLFGPDAMKRVLLDRENTLSARRSWNLIMGRIFRNGLLLRDGDDHRYHRRLMQAAFRKDALRGYVSRMNPRIARETASWGHSNGRIRAFPSFKLLTLDLACRVFLGVEPGEDTRRLNRAFEDAVAASMSIVRLRIPGLEFERGLRGREFMIRYFRSMLGAKRDGEGTDMFSRLAQAGNDEGERFSDEEVIDHLIFLMMAAHDTTTSTLASMTYELGRHPEWQERIRQESLALGDEYVEYDQMEALPSMTLALYETLRRYPPLSTIPRMATREFEWLGHRIPENAMVVVYPIHTHHMEEWWTDPFRFDPLRFSKDRAEHEGHSHLWVPFGGGAHTCLGLFFAELQVKAIVHQLVRRYRWTTPEGYAMPLQQAPISKPTDGLPLDLVPLQ